MNTMPDATSTQSVTDGSKGSLQSSFAAVIGAAAAAAPTHGDAKLAKAQNVDTKKTSSPESAKKSTTSSTDEASVAPQLAHTSVSFNQPLPVVSQPVLPQPFVSVVKENATSGDESEIAKASVLESGSTANGAGPLDATVADSRSGAITATSVQDNSKANANSPSFGTVAPVTSKVEPVAALTTAPIASPVNIANAAIAPVDATAPQTGTSTPSPVNIAKAASAPVDVATSRTTATTATPVNAAKSGSAAVDFVAARTAPPSASPFNSAAEPVDAATARTTTPTASAVNIVKQSTVGADTAATRTAPVDTSATNRQNSNDLTSNSAANLLVVANPTNASTVDANPASAVSVDSDSAKTRVAVNSDVAAVQQSLPSTVTIPAQAAPTLNDTSATAPRKSTNDVAIGSQVNTSGSSVKAVSTNVASVVTASAPVAATPLKSNNEPVSVPNAPHVQSDSTVTASSTPTAAQPQAATPKADANTVSTPQPVEVSVAAVTQQVDPTALAVPQQVALQSADVAGSSSNAANFKVDAGKSEAVGASGQSSISSVSSKGKASATDWRLNRNSTTDDKSSSVGTVSGAVAPQVVGAGNGSQQTAANVSAGNIKGALDSAALAQNAQSAQVASQAASTPTPSAPVAATQDSSATALPVPTTPADNTQATQALNSAQLIQSVHGSEMRLGMQSAEFGNISINTSLSHQTLSAQISMEHSALGHALAMHLPAIEEKLGNAYGVQAKVELRDTGSNSSLNDSGNRESSGDRRSQSANTGTATSALQSRVDALTSSNFTSTSTSTSTSMAASTSRLDIRI